VWSRRLDVVARRLGMAVEVRYGRGGWMWLCGGWVRQRRLGVVAEVGCCCMEEVGCGSGG
jgi:hypothetical protein